MTASSSSSRLGEFRAARATVEKHGVLNTFPARVQLDKDLETWSKRIPDEGEMAWLLGLPSDELLQLVGVCVAAAAFNGTVGKVGYELEEKQLLVDQVSKALGLDMAKYWTATTESYLDLVPKGLVVEAVTEALGGDSAKHLLPMKKAAAAEEAEILLAKTGWLPAPIRPIASKPVKPAKAGKRATA